MKDSEKRRREAAQSGAYQVGAGHPVAPRTIKQAISVRLDAQLLKGLRVLAEERGATVSDLLRQAATELLHDESNVTAAEFDAMFAEGEPVETVGPYDWADDPEHECGKETMQRFNALGPEVTVGPDKNQRKKTIRRVADAIWLHGLRSTGTAGSGMDISENSLAAAIVDHLNRPTAQAAS